MRMLDQAEQLTEKAGDEIPSKKSKARTETKSSDKKGSTKSVPGHSREPKDQNVSTALAKLQQRSVQTQCSLAWRSRNEKLTPAGRSRTRPTRVLWRLSP